MSIFDENPSQVKTVDEGVDYVTELVGDGKKFKDVASLARGKAEADLYIEQLKERLDETRKELENRMARESFLEEIKGLKNPSGQQEPAKPAELQPVQLDDSILEEKILKLLEQRKAKEVQETNIGRVERVLRERLGDQATHVIQNKAKELGLSTKDLEGIAVNSPAAFFQLVGVQEESQIRPNVPVARPSSNSLGNPSGLQVKNKAYFENLKRTNPKVYFDRKTTAEMIEARQKCAAAGIPWE